MVRCCRVAVVLLSLLLLCIVLFVPTTTTAFTVAAVSISSSSSSSQYHHRLPSNHHQQQQQQRFYTTETKNNNNDNFLRSHRTPTAAKILSEEQEHYQQLGKDNNDERHEVDNNNKPHHHHHHRQHRNYNPERTSNVEKQERNLRLRLHQNLQRRTEDARNVNFGDNTNINKLEQILYRQQQKHSQPNRDKILINEKFHKFNPIGRKLDAKESDLKDTSISKNSLHVDNDLKKNLNKAESTARQDFDEDKQLNFQIRKRPGLTEPKIFPPPHIPTKTPLNVVYPSKCKLQEEIASPVEHCSIPIEPPQCCSCSADTEYSVDFIESEPLTLTGNSSNNFSTLGASLYPDQFTCDSLSSLGETGRGSALNCSRFRDQFCCSSVMSLASLKDMVVSLDEPEPPLIEPPQESNEIVYIPIGVGEEETEKRKCLRLRNHTCSQNNQSKGDKKECLTSDSFPRENCCLIDHKELHKFNLQFCRKYPILRVLWPKALHKSTDGCRTRKRYNTKNHNEFSNMLLENVESNGKSNDESDASGDDYISGESVLSEHEEQTCVSQSALRHLQERDQFVGRILLQHKKIFHRMDCNDPFSVMQNCDACQVSNSSNLIKFSLK